MIDAQAAAAVAVAVEAHKAAQASMAFVQSTIIFATAVTASTVFRAVHSSKCQADGRFAVFCLAQPDRMLYLLCWILVIITDVFVYRKVVLAS